MLPEVGRSHPAVSTEWAANPRMDSFIYIVLALLAALAIIDLFVGVSNDAVNFVNSAVGCRTAPFWIIMAVASAGVLFGATFSSGMMEVAKTGVLVPEHFTFNEVIIVFTAVMVCDVLLLNTFNSLGLPTSTTVSIVFELLGGATALACYKVWSSGAPITDLGLYLNSGKALAMIMAILMSVIVAFTAGLIVQYLLRMVFSFHYERYYKLFGGVFAGVSLTAVFYFLVIKGARGASFMQPEWIEWIDANTQMLLIGCFCMLTVFFQLMIMVTRINVFRIIILAGTFSLAFAFAGNDLVNFVGVPLAALESFQIFSDVANADPMTFTMEGLRAGNKTPTYFLLASGIIMVLTLWFSKKAHRVIRTSISLASSARGGKEQFGSSLPARVTVRTALHTHRIMQQLIPTTVLKGIATRFEKKKLQPGEVELPFDELRASVNLVLAAALIASATSLKLPLSTTYVTFMVAMGSSLADGAWDRESAVYRISGVLTVISGWFMTAFTAFIACGSVCMLFMAWGRPAMLVMMGIALAIVIKTNFLTKDTAEDETSGAKVEKGDKESIRDLLTESVNENLNATLTLYADGLKAFLGENAGKLRECKDNAEELYDEITVRRGEYYHMALEGGGSKSDRDARNFYYRAFTSMKEVSHALRDQMGVAENYVANCHSPFTGRMRENIARLSDDLINIRDNFIPANCTHALALIEEAQRDFMTQIGEEKISLRKSELYLGYLLFAREVLNRYMMVKLLQAELENGLAGVSAPSAPAAQPQTAPQQG